MGQKKENTKLGAAFAALNDIIESMDQALETERDTLKREIRRHKQFRQLVKKYKTNTKQLDEIIKNDEGLDW